MRPTPCFILFWLLFVLIVAPCAWGMDFGLPLECPEQNCVIQNYYDHDPGPGWMDYACGSLSYDGHNGTDFRVSYADMLAGVPVYAAAPGRVVALRDGMDDIALNKLPPGAIKGREAGNGVRIDHGDGWITQYSHLKKGSIKVSRGQVVQAGQLLGMVGLSGSTSFPHVEFLVDYNGRAVGPFVGLEGKTGCGLGKDPLWTDQALERLAYSGAGVLEHGFSDQIPDITAGFDWGPIKAELRADSPNLIYWVALYGVRKGDLLEVRILNPDGSVFYEGGHRLEKTQAQRIEYMGKKLSGSAWPKGAYQARCTLTRGAGAQARVVVDVEAEVLIR